MRLVRFAYTEHHGEPRAWNLERTEFGKITLLVGKNASGKTRTLNVINSMASILSGRMKEVRECGFDSQFINTESTAEYKLAIHDGKVVSETYSIGGTQKLRRGPEGIGNIYAAKLCKSIDFQTPEGEVAMFARRDLIQHPWIEPIHEWSQGVRHFRFGTELGKRNMTIVVDGAPPHDPSNTEQVVAAFRAGAKIDAGRFEQSILTDLRAIGYDAEEVGVHTMPDVQIQVGPAFTSLRAEPQGLYVRERDLQCPTEQLHMSQGMFRALAVIVHINFGLISTKPSCIIIDDIGEGLDFERSSALIKLLMRKAESSDVQLIMSTNDRFVMNAVPLEYWAVLHREGHTCRLFNYQNSKDKFDSFRFTGLNNFEFFATDFVSNETVESETSESVR